MSAPCHSRSPQVPCVYRVEAVPRSCCAAEGRGAISKDLKESDASSVETDPETIQKAWVWVNGMVYVLQIPWHEEHVSCFFWSSIKTNNSQKTKLVWHPTLF